MCAKFACNRMHSFEDKRVSMLCEFGLKMPIRAPLGDIVEVKMGEMESFINFIPLGMQYRRIDIS